MQLLGILVLIFVFLIFSNRRKDKLLRDTLVKSFGKEKGKFNCSEEIESIRYYYDCKKSVEDVDDITWNDLSLDRIFNEINLSITNVGAEYLYALLRKTEERKEPLEEREKVIVAFDTNNELRIKFQIILWKIGHNYKHSVYETLDNCRSIKVGSIYLHFLAVFGFIVSVLMFFKSIWIGTFALAVDIFLSMITYYYTKKKIPEFSQWYLKSFAKMLKAAHQISRIKDIELKKYVIEIEGISKCFRGIALKSVFLTNSGAGIMADILEMILDYVRILTHADIIALYSISRSIWNIFDMVERLYEIIGFFDAMICVASYKRQLPYTSRPIFTEEKKSILEVEELYHPLVEQSVSNSIKEEKSILLTGSNASGKSTFLKAVAINAILSQTLYISTSRYYRGNYFQVFTSMALSDNLEGGESYFIVEIKAIKRILDRAGSQRPLLCCIDEVLRGTNTLERISASSEILMDLGSGNGICLAATHDIELTSILEGTYSNYHFREELSGDKIVFDYRLHKGAATTRNAIRLLRAIGYADDIVEKANARLDKYLQNN